MRTGERKPVHKGAIIMKEFGSVAVLVLTLIGPGLARSNDGFSSINRQEDGHGNYQYNYDITDWDTNLKRWETVDAENNRRGGYTITDIDGKVRQVEYTAGKNGFRAIVKTNEPGTKTHFTGDHDAIYVRDGVTKIIQDAQPALQQTGHVLKQKKLGHVHHHTHVIPEAPIDPAIPAVHAHSVRPVVKLQTPLVVPTVVQPAPVPVVIPPPPPPPVVVHRPIFHETVIQRAPEPVIPVVPKRTIAYIPPIVTHKQVHVPPLPPKPVFEHVHRVAHQPPPSVVRVESAVAPRPVVVTDIPAYTGPRRRPQKFIEDPSQAFETPTEKVILTPKRVPAYAPDQDLPEDYGTVSVPTVPPPASRLRTAYVPEKIVAAPVVKSALPVTRFAPIAIRPVYQPKYSYGPTYHTTSYQPISHTPLRCSRCSGYGKAKSR
ncbi:proline-rich extensin-like protein EPR1 [Varroa jacobsoni]|uniref:proline-rich extensin-like protein EPR1 n=1 Tax=Varroa jacobsoni TaxID=62625 RepID=UPI000BF6A030|nr:proline-rich extensin-like protein EPR1 [Varroa jacobsoni]